MSCQESLTMELMLVDLILKSETNTFVISFHKFNRQCPSSCLFGHQRATVKSFFLNYTSFRCSRHIYMWSMRLRVISSWTYHIAYVCRNVTCCWSEILMHFCAMARNLIKKIHTKCIYALHSLGRELNTLQVYSQSYEMLSINCMF